MNHKITAIVLLLAFAITAISCGKAEAPIPVDALTETNAPITESAPETEPEIETEPETEPVEETEPETEPVIEAEPETEPEPVVELEPQTEPPIITVEAVRLNASEYELKIGYAVTLTATVTPSDAADKSISWSSSDASVATVENGKITALKAGNATITAASSNGKSASCAITVPESIIAVSAVTLGKTAMSLTVGQSETLTATVSPANASDRSVTVASSNPAVAKVAGLSVTAVSAGDAVITVTSANGVSASCTVSVAAPAPLRTAETPAAETPAEAPASETPAPLRTAKKESCTTPKIVGKTYSANNRLAIAGTAENGCTIVAEGGKEVVEYYVYDGIFLLDIPYTGTKPITIYAKSDEKENSASVTVDTKGLKKGGKGLTVGKDGHLHIDATVNDYLGNNLYSDSAVKSVVKYLEKKLEGIQKSSPDTKLVVLIAPNHSTIYPETMPDYIQKQRKANATSKLQQLYKAIEGSDIICPNLTEYLTECRDELGYLIYNKTDTHWNELGAYYAYECLMNIIAEDFPSAEPIPLDEFDVFTQSVMGGDMLNYLGFDLNKAREIGVFVRPKSFEFVSGYDKPFRMNFENEWTSGEHSFKVADSTLPTMVMYRDSFSSNLLNFLAESFSASRFTSMWSYTLDTAWIKSNKPDYVIVELVERNIDTLMGLG